MKIFGTEIKKGKRTVINLPVAQLHTGTHLDIPVIIYRGKKDGPSLLLCAGIHGNEVNGVEIVRQILSNGFAKPERGMVMCIPVVNVLGFLNQTREFPDGRDLNRMFPGSKKGSLASRYAYAIMNKIVPHFDYIIDFHTGGDQRFNYSQIRTEIDKPLNIELAKVFGARFVINSNSREKSFRESATSLGKTVLLFEGGKSLNLDKVVTKIGINGVLRVMHHLGMRDFTKELDGVDKEEPIVVLNSNWTRSPQSGMFRTYAKNGKFIKKGEIIGTITDPFGKEENKLKAPHDGYVICLNHSPLVIQGDAIAHITTKLAVNGNLYKS